jgi:hypothetical protein
MAGTENPLGGEEGEEKDEKVGEKEKEDRRSGGEVARGHVQDLGLMFGTQQGMIGSILPISEEDYRFFVALTKCLNKVGAKGGRGGGADGGSLRSFLGTRC